MVEHIDARIAPKLLRVVQRWGVMLEYVLHGFSFAYFYSTKDGITQTLSYQFTN